MPGTGNLAHHSVQVKFSPCSCIKKKKKISVTDGECFRKLQPINMLGYEAQSQWTHLQNSP